MVVVIGVLLIVVVVLMIPVAILHIPVMAVNQIIEAFDRAADIREQHGLEVPWEEVAAVWATLDAHGKTRDMQELAASWVERRERVEQYTDNEGESRSRTVVTYHLRSLEQVMTLLQLDAEQAEMARRYLTAIRDGNKPSPGWVAAADTPWQAWPVPGYGTAAAISSGYGIRINPVTEQIEMHDAVDIVAPEGTPVVAAWAGTVTETGSCPVRGRWLAIRSAGKIAEYRHLSRISVSRGQRVEVATPIGQVGQTGETTGPHLCFAVKTGGRWVDPLAYY
ncbi:MAG: M23 family metallopeptidase [Syntrophomonadaceae bacterium]|nr:M23 family metallopeptidase [Syntrophomonadaceae bacterium]